MIALVAVLASLLPPIGRPWMGRRRNRASLRATVAGKTDIPAAGALSAAGRPIAGERRIGGASRGRRQGAATRPLTELSPTGRADWSFLDALPLRVIGAAMHPLSAKIGRGVPLRLGPAP